jgi:hypothetical protein
MVNEGKWADSYQGFLPRGTSATGGNPGNSVSSVIGRSRGRIPVALKMAWGTASPFAAHRARHALGRSPRNLGQKGGQRSR